MNEPSYNEDVRSAVEHGAQRALDYYEANGVHAGGVVTASLVTVENDMHTVRVGYTPPWPMLDRMFRDGTVYVSTNISGLMSSSWIASAMREVVGVAVANAWMSGKAQGMPLGLIPEEVVNGCMEVGSGEAEEEDEDDEGEDEEGGEGNLSFLD